MATGEAELHVVQAMRDGRIVVLQDRCFACWSSSLLEFSLVLTFLLPQSWIVSRSHGQYWVSTYACKGTLLC